MKKLIYIFLFLSYVVQAQFVYDKSDVEICSSKFDTAVNLKLTDKPIGQVIAGIAKTFLGTPYEAHTLEKGDSETVVVHLSGLDCYTFFETSLALARSVKKGSPDFESYLKEIENLRYRNGVEKGYISRLHYAVDWLYDNQKRGIVKDITKRIGGIPFNKKVGFMSEHPQYYKRLKDNPENIAGIKAVEDSINKREYYYIPQDEIQKAEDKIHSGDIIFCTTYIDGLLVGHTGMAVREKDGRIHYLHAPSIGKKVQLTEKPLSDYVKEVKKHTGIIVIRPLEPVN